MPTSSSALKAAAVPQPPPGNEGEAETGARQEALERMEELRSAMLRALEILYAARALFELKPDATRAEFARFVGHALERLPRPPAGPAGRVESP